MRHRVLILLAALGLAALALTPPARAASRIRCECAPLGGEFCGSDGRTYDSPCMAACFHATIVHSGPC
jgi:hypothetical protein